MSNKKSEVLLGMIRGGQPMTGGQKLNLIVQLSIPSILAQITSVMMFFIDQAMVGRISVEWRRQPPADWLSRAPGSAVV